MHFDDVFAQLRIPMWRLCLQLTGNTADAQDALQETFIDVHRGLPSFRGEAQLSTWVYRIAVRAALRVKARTRRPLVDAPENVAPDETLSIRRALEQLSAEHRTVLALFAVQGLSQKEIAAVLGVPEGTVASRVHTARKKLALLLAHR